MSNQPAPFILPAEDRFGGSNWFTWHHMIWAAAGARGVQGYLEGAILKIFPLQQGLHAIKNTDGADIITHFAQL